MSELKWMNDHIKGIYSKEWKSESSEKSTKIKSNRISIQIN